jgi:hypothetical protein
MFSPLLLMNSRMLAQVYRIMGTPQRQSEAHDCHGKDVWSVGVNTVSIRSALREGHDGTASAVFCHPVQSQSLRNCRT